MLLHKDAFTQNGPDAAEAFTQSSFYMKLLHKEVFASFKIAMPVIINLCYNHYWCSNLVSCERVTPDDSKLQFFQFSMSDVRPSFPAKGLRGVKQIRISPHVWTSAAQKGAKQIFPAEGCPWPKQVCMCLHLWTSDVLISAEGCEQRNKVRISPHVWASSIPDLHKGLPKEVDHLHLHRWCKRDIGNAVGDLKELKDFWLPARIHLQADAVR
jgi:hypothetical protein